jgi:hypothetical protein
MSIWGHNLRGKQMKYGNFNFIKSWVKGGKIGGFST